MDKRRLLFLKYQFQLMQKLLLFIFSFFTLLIKAQNCGFDLVMQEMLQDPAQKKRIEKRLAEMSQNTQENQVLGGAPPVFIIPVVVHVVHDGGTSNISEAQIFDAIKVLNDDFKKLNADTSQIVSAFKSIAADAKFEFRLATIDPNGNCTKGYTRTLSYLTNVGSGEPIKDIIGWDTKKYFNIWVVNYLESGGNSVGGYCYLPGTAPSQSHEGVIVINRQFGSIGTSYGAPLANHTLSHEAGHFFGLLHTWGTGNIGSNCGNDGISDTPPTKGSNGICNLNQNLCSGLENVQNIMDYATCPCMFTEGQASYMRTVAAQAAGYRSSLSTNANLIATGTEDNHVVHECAPIVNFKAHNDSTFFCAGRTISFDDLSYNDSLSNNRTYEWTFNGGSPASSTLANPSVLYKNAGVFDVKCKISNAHGSDSLIKSNYITVIDNSTDTTLWYFEGFENSGFPNNPGNNNTWKLFSPGNITSFKRTTVTKKSGTASVVLDLHSESGYSNSEMWHYMLSPNINTSTQSDSLFLDFNYAYAQRSAGNNDLLRIYVSTDCGENWYFKKGMNAAQLSTKTITTADFIPGISEWGSTSVDLSAHAGNPNLRLLFAANAKGGNKLYLDNINFYHINVGVKEYLEANFSLKVYPNPIEEESVLEINSGTIDNFNIEIYDALGKKIVEKMITNNGSNTKVNLSNLLQKETNGVYYIQVTSNNKKQSIKIIK